MDIKQYFKSRDSNFEDTLLKKVPKASIRAVEKELKERAEAVANIRSGSYVKITDKERATIGGYAARNGVTAALHHFKQTKEYPGLKEATVRGWKNLYQEELKRRSKKRGSCNDPIIQLPAKRRGRPLLVGNHLEAEIKLFLEAMRKDGSVVNTQVVIATAVGVISSYDANLLAEHGGPIEITKDWAKRLLGRMGLVK